MQPWFYGTTENLSLSYLSVRAVHESIPVSSNSIINRESVARVVLNIHPQKSCTSQNFPDSLALLFSLLTLSFSLFHFHLSNLTLYDCTQPVPFPHHCSTSTVFSLLHPLPAVPIKLCVVTSKYIHLKY